MINMNIFFNNQSITLEELKHKLNELGPNEVLELYDVDEQGNFYFEINVYGYYY